MISGKFSMKISRYSLGKVQAIFLFVLCVLFTSGNKVNVNHERIKERLSAGGNIHKTRLKT